MKEIIYILPLLVFSSCANVASTKLSYTDVEGRTTHLEFPKELKAKNIKVVLDFEKGTVEIIADDLSTSNVATIQAQASRESDNLEKVSKISDKVAEGAARGAVSGVVP